MNPETNMERALPVLLPQNIQSLQVCGIWRNHQLWGFIGIDYVRNKHNFTARSLWAISSVSNLIGLALAKEMSVAELRDSKINSELLSHLTQSSYFKMDTVTRKIVQSGSELSALLPVEDGFLPQPEDYVHPDDLKIHVKNQHEINSGRYDSRTWDFRLMRDGKCKHMHICTRFVKDARGNPFIFGAVQDISEVVNMVDRFNESLRKELLNSHNLNERLQTALSKNQDFIRQDEIIKQCYSRLLLTDTLIDACREVTEMLGRHMNNTITNISRYYADGRPRVESLANWKPVPCENMSFELFYEDQMPLTFAHLKAGNMVHCFSSDFQNQFDSNDYRGELRYYFNTYHCDELYCLPLIRNRKFWGYIAAEVHHKTYRLGSSGERIMNSALQMFEILISRMENRELILKMEAEQQLMLDILPIPIVLLTPDTTILHCNRAFDAIVDIKTSLKGLNCQNRICGKDCVPELCPVRRTLETSEPQNFEKFFKAHNYLVKTMPIFENGVIVKIIVAYIDLTEIAKRRTLLQEALIKAKGAAKPRVFCLATMSQEIRTHLNSTIGFSELLQDSALQEDERAEYLQAINVAGTSLLHLINDILDLSKAEADQYNVVKTPLNIKTMLFDLRSLFRQKLLENHIEFKITADTVPILMMDAPHIRQILLNLIGNAVKFTVHGVIEARVAFENSSLTIVLQDGGCGISPQALPRIFDPFVQDSAHPGAKKIMAGIGLGLPIVKRLVENMNGTISVESTLGKGTTFTLALPEIEPCAADSVAVAEAASDVIPHGLKVLIIDDVKMNLKILGAMLKKLGCTVISESDPEKALSLVAPESPALIMTDIWMPVLNGTQFALKVREIPGFAHVPIIAVTADNASETNFDTSPFDDILLKPLNMQHLSHIVSRYGKEQVGK